MKNISIIACVGKKRELGKNNDLIWHLPNDLKYFKNVTKGKTIIMGRKTFESLPGVLPNRRNIVLTKREDLIDGVEVFHDVDSVLENIKEEKEVFVIGGANIYQQFLDYANKIYLTEVDETCDDADIYFPNFDKGMYERKIIGSNEENGIKYQFIIYEKK